MIFGLPKKRARLRTKIRTTNFGKSLFLTQYWVRYVIYIPPNTNDLAANLTMVACGNQQKRNNGRTSKQLRFVSTTYTINGNQALDIQEKRQLNLKIKKAIQAALYL